MYFTTRDLLIYFTASDFLHPTDENNRSLLFTVFCKWLVRKWEFDQINFLNYSTSSKTNGRTWFRMSLPDYLYVNSYLSAALAVFPTLVEIEKLPKQSINQEVCQSKAGGINQSCELTAEVWHHNKSYSSPNSMSYSQEELKWHLSVKDTVGKCKWSAVRKMSLSHQAQCVWLLLMCFYGDGKVGDIRVGGGCVWGGVEEARRAGGGDATG